LFPFFNIIEDKNVKLSHILVSRWQYLKDFLSDCYLFSTTFSLYFTLFLFCDFSNLQTHRNVSKKVIFPSVIYQILLTFSLSVKKLSFFVQVCSPLKNFFFFVGFGLTDFFQFQMSSTLHHKRCYSVS